MGWRHTIAGLAAAGLLAGCSKGAKGPGEASNSAQNPANSEKTEDANTGGAKPLRSDGDAARSAARKAPDPLTASVEAWSRQFIDEGGPGKAPAPSLLDSDKFKLSLGPAQQVDQPKAADAPAPRTDATPKRMVTNDISDGQRAGDDLEQKLLRRLKDNPRDVVSQLDYQMLQLLKDEPTPQAGVITPLAADDREIVSAVCDAFVNFRNACRADGNMLSARKIKPFKDMVDRLKAQADLRIPTLELCRKVSGFGKYDPIENATFVAGKPHDAIIYCEVENFASQLNEKRQWETSISEEAQLFSESGLIVWSIKRQAQSDVTRNRRHDFYILDQVSLPASLPVNRYILKVTVVDHQANRVAEATIPVMISAQ